MQRFEAGEELLMRFSSTDMVLSINPKYAAMIMDGEKTVELRRRFPGNLRNGTQVVIYVTAPDKFICGFAAIAHIETRTVHALWRRIGPLARVSKEFFYSYFQGVDKGYAVHLVKPRRRCLSR